MHRRVYILQLATAAAFLLTFGHPAAAQTPTYQVINLGTLTGDAQSTAAAINARGEVVGTSSRPATRTSPARERAFLWLPAEAYGRAAGMNDLGTLGGKDSKALSINAHGEVVGMSSTPPSQYFPNGDSHPFLWLPAPAYGLAAGMHDLQSQTAGTGWTLAFAAAPRINDAGQILGADDDLRRAFLLDLRDRSITDLGSLGGRNLPGALNSPLYDEFGSLLRGTQLAGASYKGSGGSFYAYRWESATGPQALNLFNSSTVTSSASAINGRGEIGGYYVDGSGNSLAFTWAAGVTRSLGTLGGTRSQAYALNDSTVVVGEAHTSRNRAIHAFRWDSLGGMKDLNTLKSANDTSGLELISARGINGAGRIAGSGVIKGGFQRAFVLAPQ